ncbi:DUF1349 domain-containing protein [Candidatus Bathyarchaeota archaeon]|nr:DUF1349 domain-containing protein [Candidatus Bathyarchaeota archaeon]
MKKITFLIVILIALSTLPSHIEKTEASPATLRVPQDYPTIQAAINVSSSGDTIQIASGTYNENLRIDPYFGRPGTFISILITGQSPSNTVVNGNFSIYYGNSTSIMNLDIKGKLNLFGDYYIQNRHNVYVSNCIVRNGVSIVSKGNAIVDSTIYGNITIIPGDNHGDASNNLIKSNTILSGGVILLLNRMSSDSNNTISGNAFINAPVGVLEKDGTVAIYGQNNIKQNSFINCGIGVKIVGIPGWGPSRSTISGNIFERCSYGIMFTTEYGSGNLNVSVSQNSFIDNTVQASVDPAINNMWDSGYPGGGNYWSDYRSEDFYHGVNQNLVGSDGIGDTPYVMNVNNTDRYPLMSFSDEFSSTSVNERWAWTHQPQSWFTSSGSLLISPTLGTNLWSGDDSGQFMYQWMSGNFMVETKVSATLTTNYQQAGLMIRQDADNWAKINFEYSDGVTVKTGINRNGVASPEQITSVPTSTSTVWLRVVRNGDSYTAYSSFDGLTWTQHYSWSQPLQGTLMVGLCVTDANCMVAFQPSFDYFRYSNLASSSYSIQAGGSTFPCAILSNSQVSSFTFSQASKKIGFSVTGDAGIAGVCNVTFPTQLLGEPYVVLIDGSPRPATVTYDATHTSVHFAYSHSVHQVEIIGASVVPEFPTIVANMLVLTAMALMLFATRRNQRMVRI